MRYAKPWMNWLVTGMRIVALGSVAAVGLYVVAGLQVVRVPPGLKTMQPAFSPGDSLLVKTRLPFTRLARGDVVLFRSAAGSGLARVAGFPGESLRLGEGALFVDGCEVDYPFVSADNEGGDQDFGPVEVGPGKVLLIPDAPSASEIEAVRRVVPLKAVRGIVVMRL